MAQEVLTVHHPPLRYALLLSSSSKMGQNHILAFLLNASDPLVEMKQLISLITSGPADSGINPLAAVLSLRELGNAASSMLRRKQASTF